MPLITEYGDYPLNAKLQKLYPRGHYFREVLDVVHASGRAVPVFIDKHLSYSRAEAQRMVDQARALNVPLMAGSSLPVTWRLCPPGPHDHGRPRRLARQPRDLRLPRLGSSYKLIHISIESSIVVTITSSLTRKPGC